MSRQPKAIAVSITPFASDGALDLDGLEAHLRRLVGFGLTLCVGGSGTEEGFTLDPVERRAVVETAVGVAGDRVGVRLNVREPRRIQEAIADVELAAELGCEAAHVPTLDIGHGYRPSERELRRYFSRVIDGASLPVVISSSQAMGYTVPVSILEEVADDARLLGVVCSTSDTAYISRTIAAVGRRCDVYVAGVTQVANALTLGGAGFLSPDANIAPEHCAGLIEAWKVRDHERFFASLEVLLRLAGVSGAHTATAVAKTVLRENGVLESYVREPRFDLQGQVADNVVADVRQLLERESRCARGVA